MARDPSAVETPKRKELGGTRSRSTEWGHVDVDTFVSSSLHIMIIMLHESLHMRQHLSLICACGMPSLIFWWPLNCALLLFSNACGSMVAFFFCLSYFLSLSLSEVFTLFSQPFVREHFRGRINLVGGLEHEFYDFPIGNVIIPTDELIFFRGVAQPPTTNGSRFRMPSLR